MQEVEAGDFKIYSPSQILQPVADMDDVEKAPAVVATMRSTLIFSNAPRKYMNDVENA